MTTLTALQPLLDSLLPQFSPQPTQKCTSQIADDRQFTSPLLRRLHFAICKTKQTIFTQISSIRDASSDLSVSVTQKHMLKIFGSKLEVLDSNANLLLKEGILNLYMELSEARTYATKKQVSPPILKILNCGLESTINLLRVYFVFHEFRQSLSKDKQNHMQLFKEITEEELALMESKISEKSIELFLQKESVKIEREMREGLEICRICSLKIRLDEIQKHVKMCQRRGCLKQELVEKASQMALLLQELKQKQEKTADGLVKCKLDEDYRLLVKLILSSERKRDRPIDRRCSLVTMPSEKSIHNKIEQCIQLYLEEHGDDALLEKILDVIKAKANIQKTISSLDSAQLVDPSPDKPSAYKPTLRKTNRLPTTPHPLPTRENLSNSSIENTDGDTEKEQDSEVNLQKSKKSLSKRTRQSQDALLGTLRSYSSLHEIVVEAEVEDQPISLQSFEILKFLGQGAFGKVYLVRRTETKDIYALKIIRISETQGQTHLASIKNQHQIFKKIGGNHLVKAPFSFNERSSHIFVLQYLPGGDLRRMLDDEVYFEEERAQFYLAEIILAIEHLHKFNIIHRDLKPQNLVIDRSGHLKLTDFGLSQLQMNEKLKKSRNIQRERLDSAAKYRKRRTAVLSSRHKRRLIGTPDYIAPEIINGISLTNFTIDWWSLGVMAYELLIGTRPFCADSIDEVIDNIRNFNLEWPEVGRQEGMISAQAKDLIEKLLNKDFTNRLGSKGAEEIKRHPFFQAVDWQNIKTSKPAFLPKLANLSEYSQAPQDPALLQEIHELIGVSTKSKPQLKLERFVRFDLLGSETIQSVQKVHQQQNLRLKRLKTLQEISNDDRQRLDDL